MIKTAPHQKGILEMPFDEKEGVEDSVLLSTGTMVIKVINECPSNLFEKV